MSSLQTIATVSELRAAIAAHPDCADGTLCGVPNTKRAASLTTKEIDKLNAWAAENVKVYVFHMTTETAIELLGARQIEPGTEPPVFSLGKPPEYYATDNNAHNRVFSKARLGNASKEGYVFDLINGLWTLGDPLIVGADGVVGSAQHRAIAKLTAQALSEDTLPPTPFILITGLPPQFGDNLDKSKQRTATDREYRDTTKFTDALLEACLEEPPTSDSPASTELPTLRQSWSSDLVSLQNWILCRLRGVDIHASKTKLPSEREREAFLKRFPEVDASGCDELQKLVLVVDEASRTADGKKATWTKYFTPPMVGTALVLASLRESEANPDSVAIDWELVETQLQLLQESGDEGDVGYSPAFADLSDASKRIKNAGGSAPRSNEKFGCLVTAMSSILDDGVCPSKVWQGARDRKKASKDKTYRIFGGADIGYQEPVKD